MIRNLMGCAIDAATGRYNDTDLSRHPYRNIVDSNSNKESKIDNRLNKRAQESKLHRSVAYVQYILHEPWSNSSFDRSMVPIRAAPANGLTLEHVFYDEYGTYTNYQRMKDFKDYSFTRNELNNKDLSFPGERIIKKFDTPLQID